MIPFINKIFKIHTYVRYKYVGNGQEGYVKLLTVVTSWKINRFGVEMGRKNFSVFMLCTYAFLKIS